MTRLRVTYLVALSAVAALSFSAYTSVRTALDVAEADGAVINVAGRQRMLSQRIAKAVLRLRYGHVDDRGFDVDDARDELQQAVEDLLAAHAGLVEGNPSRGLPGLRGDDPLRRAFAELEPDVDCYRQVHDALASGRSARDLDTSCVVAASDHFLPRMQEIVVRLEGRSKARIDALQGFETGLLLATILILLLEAGIVFEPAARRIRQQMLHLHELRRSAESAHNASRTLFASVSHEFRTPLTAIMGFAELAADDVCDPDERRDLNRRIRVNCEHLLGLVNDVLDFSKIEAGQLEIDTARVDVRAAVHDAMEICAALAERKSVVLKLECIGEIPEYAETDALRVRQCIINLLSNAIRFTPGGTVVVRMRADRRAGLWFVDVADNGCGIPTDRLEAIFEPFKQVGPGTAASHGGTGLGLAITRQLATRLGGGVEVESAEGQGSTFTAWFAVGDPPGNAWVTSPYAESDVTTSRKVERLLRGDVLVIDDGADIRRLRRAVLERAGATVEEADDGIHAVHLLDERRGQDAAPWSAVLCDLQMPGLDGYGTVQAFRSRGHDGPMVALTASGADGEIERCRSIGFDACLPKPFRKSTLLRELVAVIEAHRARNAASPTMQPATHPTATEA